MNLKNTLTDLQMKTLNVVHKGLLKVSGNRLGTSAGGMPAVELHTIGRKSGQKRSTMLTSPIHDDEQIVLVASKGGDERHPEWYLNLTANPDVEVTIAGTIKLMHARTASVEEKAELWPRIVAKYKGYGGYQRKASREIPVVICEPRES